ncbi:MAG: hypothetical protein V4701_04520 [Pseudomonadota bacterium]
MAVVLANSLSVGLAVGASLAMMAGVLVVSYDILVCPRCRESIFKGQAPAALGAPRRRCSRCDLDLTTHRLGDRGFEKES